jgi:hypothetical protein
MREWGLGIIFVLLVVSGLAWYLGAPTYFVVILGVLWLLWLLSGVVETLNATTETVPSYTSSPPAPTLKKSVVDRELGGGRTGQVSPHDLRTLPYREYLQTPHWKHRRQDRVRVAGYRCQFCNRGSVTLNVHHRTYERLGEEHDGDLTVFCQDCHHILHKHRSLGR